MIRKLLLFLCIMFSISLFANDNAEIQIYKHTLKNGLKIIVAPADSNGIIHFGILYNVGSVDDPVCKTGLSHFLEHMMFNGTKNISKDRLNYLLNKYSSYSNAYTGKNYTFYCYEVRKEFLKMNLKIEADRMENLVIDNDEFEREKKVILEERRMTQESNPLNRYLNEAAPRTVYLYSNYAYPAIGYAHQIENITRESLIKHYKKYYVPNNATLIFVGDIQKDEAVEMADMCFGNIKNTKAEIKTITVLEPLNTGLKYCIEKTSPEIKIRELEIIYSFDKEIVDSLKKLNIYNFLTGILFGSSVFEKIMLDDKNLISWFNVNLDVNKGNKAFVSIVMHLQEGIDREIIEKEFLKVIHEFKDKHLTEELLKIQKEKTHRSFKFISDSPAGLFSSIVNGISSGYTLEDMINIHKIIDEITLDDIKSMIDKIFKDRNISHKIYIKPDNTVIKQ